MLEMPRNTCDTVPDSTLGCDANMLDAPRVRTIRSLLQEPSLPVGISTFSEIWTWELS